MGSPLKALNSDRKSHSRMLNDCAWPLVSNIILVGWVLSCFTNIAQLTMPSIISHAELRMMPSCSTSFIFVPLRKSRVGHVRVSSSLTCQVTSMGTSKPHAIEQGTKTQTFVL